MKVLLSIKPKYVCEIIKSNKKYEFRRKIFKQEVESIIVYSSSPEKKVLGEIFFSKILVDSPINIWNQCHKYSGINKSDFLDYFKGSEIAYAIKIDHFYRYPTPLNLNDIKHELKPPQSFVYIK